MHKELRLNLSDDISSALSYDGVVLGDEGCIYRALSENWYPLIEQAASNKLTIRYLTPPIPEKMMECFMKNIERLVCYPNLKITFNDYGGLYSCAYLIKRNKINPVLGRIITHSLLDSPWYKELLTSENSTIQSAMFGYSFVHKSKLELFGEYNINEIEVNINDLSYLKELKFNVTAHCKNNIISVSRVCHSARWNNLKLPNCDEVKCREKLRFSLSKKWGKLKSMYETPTDTIKEYYQNLYLEGNIVYKDINYDLLEDYEYILTSAVF